MSISIAARFAGVVLDEHFYGSPFKPGTYPRLNNVERVIQQQLNEEAINQIETARQGKTYFAQLRTFDFGSASPEEAAASETKIIGMLPYFSKIVYILFDKVKRTMSYSPLYGFGHSSRNSHDRG